MSDEKPIATQKVQFTARVFESDKQFINEFIKKYPTQHEGMQAFVASVNNGLGNDNELFTSVNELIKNNEALTLEIEALKAQQQLPNNAFTIEFTPAFIAQLTKLRRYLKSKEMIPNNSTELEFMQKFIASASETYVKNKYDFLNR